MAKRTSTIVIDDLTGAELGADTTTVTSALDGAAYEIDLASAAADKLREGHPVKHARDRLVGQPQPWSANAGTTQGSALGDLHLIRPNMLKES